MSDITYDNLLHIAIDEISDPLNMDMCFLLELDRAIDAFNIMMVITSSNSKADYHSKESYHYKGLAVDCVLYDRPTRRKLTLLESYLFVSRFDFGGCGLYAVLNGMKVIDWYLHIDGRPVEELSQNTRWIATISDDDRKGIACKLKKGGDCVDATLEDLIRKHIDRDGFIEDRVTRLEEGQKSICITLDRWDSRLEKLSSGMDSIQQNVIKLIQTVNGNGKAGLCQIIEDHNQRLSDIDLRCSKRESMKDDLTALTVKVNKHEDFLTQTKGVVNIFRWVGWGGIVGMALFVVAMVMEFSRMVGK